MNWGVFLGAFTGSLIELVEILAVVMIVGRVAGWPNALVGSSSAISLTVFYLACLREKSDASPSEPARGHCWSCPTPYATTSAPRL